jgi:hypothetical protein
VKYVVGFARFWWDFVVGDDWTVAAFVVVAVAITVGLGHAGHDVWWFLPIVVAVGLSASLWRASRPRSS